jgi:hypothetical protein
VFGVGHMRTRINRTGTGDTSCDCSPARGTARRVTADMPAGLVAARPSKPPLMQPPPVVTDVKTAARVIAAATAIPAALWMLVVFAPNGYVGDGSLALLLPVVSSTFLGLIVLLLSRRR